MNLCDASTLTNTAPIKISPFNTKSDVAVAYVNNHIAQMKKDLFDMMTNPPVFSSILSSPKEGENPMGYYDDTPCKSKRASTDINVAVVAQAADTTDRSKIDRLSTRLARSYDKKFEKLYSEFFNDNSPKTIKDAIERIKKGEYRLNEKQVKMAEDALDEEEYFPYGWAFGLRWQTEERDRKKYDAVLAQLKKDFEDAKDVITVLTPEEGLAALREFDAKEYTFA